MNREDAIFFGGLIVACLSLGGGLIIHNAGYSPIGFIATLPALAYIARATIGAVMGCADMAGELKQKYFGSNIA